MLGQVVLKRLGGLINGSAGNMRGFFVIPVCCFGFFDVRRRFDHQFAPKRRKGFVDHRVVGKRCITFAQDTQVNRPSFVLGVAVGLTPPVITKFFAGRSFF